MGLLHHHFRMRFEVSKNAASPQTTQEQRATERHCAMQPQAESGRFARSQRRMVSASARFRSMPSLKACCTATHWPEGDAVHRGCALQVTPEAPQPRFSALFVPSAGWLR